MKVVLIGNYEPDGQRSMARFAGMLMEGLRGRVEFTLLKPAIRAGRLRGGNSTCHKWLGYVDKFVLFRRDLLSTLRAGGKDQVVHILDQGNAMYAPWVRKYANLITCHDVLAIREARGEFNGRMLKYTGRLFQRWNLQGLARAQRVACVSEATRGDLARLLEHAPRSPRLEVIPNGIAETWKPASRGEAKSVLEAMFKGAEPVTSPGYLLHVSGDQWYKNTEGVVRLYLRLRQVGERPWKLVMVGPMLARYAEFFTAAGVRDHVHFVSIADDDQLRALYSLAEALLFPSLEEGFGWPVLEAQACGCRVVTTDKAPMSEIGGKAATYLKPGRAGDDSWVRQGAETVRKVLVQTTDERETLVKLGRQNAERFSTVEMIEKYLHAYQACLNREA